MAYESVLPAGSTVTKCLGLYIGKNLTFKDH